MANSITHYGQHVMLHDDGANAVARATDVETGLAGNGTGTGGFIEVAARLHLYASGSTLAKDKLTQNITDASGGGYAYKTISSANWTVQIGSGNQEVVLADQVWTASGGSISNIAGAYMTDGDNNVMAWWERTTAVTLNDTDSITADDLTIRPT